MAVGGGAALSTWTALERMPANTQAAVTEQLHRLKDAGKESVTILVVGKSGVGKSSTVNTLIGDRVCATSPFQAETMRPVEQTRTWEGLTLNVIDTPGLVEGGDVNERVLKIILRHLLGRVVDVLVYVDRLDLYAVDTLDRLVVHAISTAFGKQIWGCAVVVLTRAQFVPPDGRSFSEFAEARVAALRDLIRKESSLGRDNPVPVRCVENIASRWRSNDEGDHILPDGTLWLAALWGSIADAALARVQRPVVDERMVEGPDPNQRGKFLIPLVIVAQVFLIFFPLRRGIEEDKKEERRNRPKWEVEAEDYRRSGSAQMARKLAAEIQQQQKQQN